MQQSAPFFSNDMEGWLKVGGFLLTLCLVIWGAVKARLISDINIRRDVDGVGGRVAILEKANTELSTKVSAMESQVSEARIRDDNLLTRVGAVEESHRSIERLVRDHQDIMRTQVQEIKDAVNGEQTRIRERVVVLETMSALRKQGRLKDDDNGG